MRKLKTALAVFLTVAVLVAGAYIPRLVARVLDGQAAGESSVNPMASIELTIRQELSGVGKLVMLNHAESLLHISPSKAAMTEEEVTAAVYREIAPYMDTQLAQSYGEYVQMQPYLVQISDIPQLQRVVWRVTLTGKGNDYSYFDLLIDDETGKILRINYTAGEPQSRYATQESLELFTEIFFSGLEIEDYWQYVMENQEVEYAKDSGMGYQFRFEDPQYGEAYVELFAYDYGFYVAFPNS